MIYDMIPFFVSHYIPLYELCVECWILLLRLDGRRWIGIG
jgi:hypothetical protein